MKLFKPRAPHQPPIESMRFGFSSDGKNPDGSLRMQSAPPQLAAAVVVVAAELGRLRAVVAERGNYRDKTTLGRAIEQARSNHSVSAAALELARRKYVGGGANMAEVTAEQAKYSATHGAIHSLQMELQRREMADQAHTELTTLLKEIE